MNLCRAISALMLVCLLPHGVAAQEEPPTPPSSAAGACTIVGPVLGPTDFGVEAGLPLADASAVLLEDGRVRLYMFAQDRGIVSAVSLTTEGVSFIAEEGERRPDGAGMPRVVASPDGDLRLFYTSSDGIMSAWSEDGLTFTVEPGFRITAEEAGFTGATAGGAASGATVVQLADGRYRMYFSDLPRPGDEPGGHWIKSAVSDDQFVWTVEEGVRLGPDAPLLIESAEHPFALANPDGTVTLYYGKFPGPGSASEEGLYESTSVDGLTFEEETYDVFFANNPDALRLVDGSLVVYYGQFDPVVGGTINVAQCPDPSAVVADPSPGDPDPDVPEEPEIPEVPEAPDVPGDSSSVSWQFDGLTWQAAGTPPPCPRPLTFPTPIDLSLVTSILYPGQTRGGNYKPHGGFRLDGPAQSADVQVVAPMAMTIYRGARYLAGDEVQYSFDFISDCGIMHRFDHLLDLSPRLQLLADAFPPARADDSRQTPVAPGQAIEEGEVLATAVGLRTTGNIFLDWGVLDLRARNAASEDPEWLAQHSLELDAHGICWFDNLEQSDAERVRSLPPADSVSGSMSDYCQ